MEFKKMMTAWRNMCDLHTCINCPIRLQLGKKLISFECKEYLWLKPQELENILFTWYKGHSEKTIADDLFERYPNAPKTKDGIPIACAADLGYIRNDSRECEKNKSCAECWKTPLSESNINNEC